MGTLSRIRSAFMGTQGAAGMPARPGVRRDRAEDRDPTAFARLEEVIRLAREDRRRCLKLCREQIRETPDYDLPYIWASNFEASSEGLRPSLRTLRRGLVTCRRVSGLLTKQGERYLEARDAPRMTVAFGHAILAQQPARSKHDPYLYFGYICCFGGYDNAGRKALMIARRITRNIDLTGDTQREIQRLVLNNQPYLNESLREMTQAMLEEGRID